MNDYITTLFSMPNLNAVGILSLFLLVFIRLVPIVSLAPFLGAKVAPMITRAGMAVCFSIILLPTLIATSHKIVAFDMLFIGYALKEFFIGLILGFIVTIPFYIAQTAGSLIDYLRGSSFMMAQDITLQVQTSPIGSMYNYILIVMFFELSGPFYFIDAIVESYKLVPADQFFNTTFFQLSTPFWKLVMDLLNRILTISIQISAPALLAILMAEMFLGIANRLAPQVQISFLGISLKSLAGLTLLWAGWFFILKQFGKQTTDWLKVIFDLIKNLKPLV